MKRIFARLLSDSTKGFCSSLGLVYPARARLSKMCIRDRFREAGLGAHPQLLELGEFIMAPRQFAKVRSYLLEAVKEFHAANPLSPGPSKETLRAATGLPARLFDQVLRKIPELSEVQGFISSQGHELTLSPQEEQKLQELRELIGETPYEPPSLSELLERGYSKELIYAGAVSYTHLAPGSATTSGPSPRKPGPSSWSILATTPSWASRNRCPGRTWPSSPGTMDCI